MGIFHKFKRHPPKVADAYYAEFTDDSVDLKSEVIKHAVDQAKEIDETWPYVTLGDLKIILDDLKQNAVLPTGKDVNLGSLEYMENNPETNEPEATGLSWSPVIVSPESENFVVETVRQTLNDEDTRLDDSLQYSMLANAFDALFEGAKTYADLSEDDLPTLPSEEQFDHAVKNNETIEVEEKRFQRTLPDDRPVNMGDTQEHKYTTGDTTEITTFPSYVPEDESSSSAKASRYNTEEIHTQNTSQRQAMTEESIVGESKPEPSKETSSNSQQGKRSTPPREENSRSDEGHNVPATQQAHAPKPTNDVEDEKPKTRSARIYSSDPLSVLNAFTLEAPKFLVDESLLNQTPEPGDTGFIGTRLAKERQEANDFLVKSAQGYTASIRDMVLAALDKSTVDDQVALLLNSDWQAPIKEKIKVAVNDEFKEKTAQAVQHRQDQYDADVQAENDRHSTALKQLSTAYDTDVDSIKEKASYEAEQIITARQQAAITSQTLYIDKAINELQEKESKRLSNEIASKLNKYKQKATKNLGDAYTILKGQIEQTEAQLVKQQEDVISARTEADREKAKSEDVTTLLTQKTTLEKSQAEMTEKVNELMAKLSESEHQKSELQASNRTLTDQLSKLQGNFEQMKATQSQLSTDDLLKTFLAKEMANKQAQVQPEPAKTHHYGAIAGVLGTLLVAGAVGTGGYYWTQQQHREYVAASESREASMKSSIAAAKSSSKEAASKADAKGSKKEVDKQTAETETSTAPTNNPFRNLDADVKNNHSLAVYNQFFKNQNLETDARVWAVGKLLMNAGLYNDAWALANANPGHNQTLVQALQGGN